MIFGSCLIISDSAKVSTFVELLLEVALTSVWFVPPGVTVRRFVPRDSTFERIDLCAHSPIPIKTTTERIPIMIPRLLSQDLSLLAVSELMAFFM